MRSFVRSILLVTALLTVASRGSPLHPRLDSGSDNKSSSATAPLSISTNGTFPHNVNDNLLVSGLAANNKTAPKLIVTSTVSGEPCETEPFCETEEHPVPDDIQLKVLEQNFNRLRPFFNKDPINPPDLYRSPIFFDGDDEFVQACETKSWTIDRPKEVRDIDGQRHFLLNPELGGYRQSITLLRCSDEQQPCRNIEHILPSSKPSRCETRFWHRQMTAINQNTLEPYEIIVKVPAACNCYIKATIDYYSSPLKN